MRYKLYLFCDTDIWLLRLSSNIAIYIRRFDAQKNNYYTNCMEDAQEFTRNKIVQ